MSTVPPSGASTRAAALARFKAKSTVIGCSPTRPRTPSVPKYLRPNFLCLRPLCISAVSARRHRLQRIHRRGHIMCPDDARVMQYRHDRERHAAGEPIAVAPPEDARQERFSRKSDRDRPVPTRQLIEVPQEGEIVRRGLAEPEARI